MLNIYYSAVHCSRYFYHSWVFLKRKPFFFVIFHWTWTILLCWSYVDFLVLFFKGCWCRSMKCVNSSISMVLTQLLSKHGRVKRQNLSWKGKKTKSLLELGEMPNTCTQGVTCMYQRLTLCLQLYWNLNFHVAVWDLPEISVLKEDESTWEKSSHWRSTVYHPAVVVLTSFSSNTSCLVHITADIRPPCAISFLMLW